VKEQVREDRERMGLALSKPNSWIRPWPQKTAEVATTVFVHRFNLFINNATGLA